MIRAEFLAAAFCAMLAGCAAPAPGGRDRAVFDTIASRLALMKPVAAWKYARGIAVEDLAREAVVLDRATEDAAANGIDAQSVRPFFQAQIEAAKAIQTCWIGRWKAGTGAPPADPPGLKTEIRPRLIALGKDLLAAIREALRDGTRFDPEDAAAFAERVALDCLPPDARETVYDRLGNVRLAQ